MGAFDGYRLPSGEIIPHEYFGGGELSSNKVYYPWFKNQPAFDFFKGFGVPELTALLAAAEAEQYDTVWVPRERPGNGHIGLSTWYVRALLQEHSKNVE